MKTVLGLGGNLGNREENLAMAVEELEKLPRTRLLAMSNLYETWRQSSRTISTAACWRRQGFPRKSF